MAKPLIIDIYSGDDVIDFSLTKAFGIIGRNEAVSSSPQNERRNFQLGNPAHVVVWPVLSCTLD